MTKKTQSAKNERNRFFSVRTVIAFLLTLILCCTLVGIMTVNRSMVEELKMEQLILEKSTSINNVLTKLLYKTQMLSSLVLQRNGDVKDFEQIAATIIDDPAILNILIAPDGIVTDVYPIEVNKSVLGWDFFSEGAGNKEAALAIETGELVLGGPFDAVQGGQIIVGRLPVYLDGADGSKEFWGLVSVTLRYPQALDGAGLNELIIQGFAYEVWRVNPDTNERQIISSSGHNYDENTKYVEKSIEIANAEWYFRILPVRDWYEFSETWISAIISILISLLLAAVVKNNRDLKSLNLKLKSLSNTDPLTGIYNRRYFLDTAACHAERVIRDDGESYIILLDLDNFKRVNDQYGHQAGDSVLQEITRRAANILREYDMLARYGGEEFIVFVADISREEAANLAERIRLSISGNPVMVDGNPISITASFGVAPAAPLYRLETAIAMADEALYKAKEAGRDRVAVYEGEGIVSITSEE